MRRYWYFAMPLALAALALASSAPAAPGTAPTITAQPDISVVAAAGGSTSFAAAAAGSPAPTVQWQDSFDRSGPWTDIAGAASPTLTVVVTPGTLGNVYRAVFTNASGTAISRPARLVSTKDWMRDLGSDIADVPLTELTIPGSHDMGTYGITDDSGTSLDNQSSALACTLFDGACESYTRAQDDRDATQELNDGIRYFDLRVCGQGEDGIETTPADFVAFSADPITCHGLNAASFGDILSETRAFAQANPSEVVYLDIDHLFQADPDTIAYQVEQAFTLPGGGSLLIPPQYCTPTDPSSGTCAGNLTLRTIANKGLGNVIVNFENDGAPGDVITIGACGVLAQCTSFNIQPTLDEGFYARHPLLWGRAATTTAMHLCTVAGAEASCFGNDNDIDTVLAADEQNLDTRETFAEPHPTYQFQHFYVQFLQTTPDGSYIASHPTSSLLDMADGATPFLGDIENGSNPIIEPAIFGCDGEWNTNTCFAQHRPENVNIVAINFYNRSDYNVWKPLNDDEDSACEDHDATCPLTAAEQSTLICGPTIANVCNYADPIHFDFVREVLSFDEYARTAPVVTVSTGAQPTTSGWYNAAALGGAGTTLGVKVSATDYRYDTGITALGCTDNSSAIGPASNAPTRAFVATGLVSLGDGAHSISCQASDGAAAGTHAQGNTGAGPGSTQAATFKVDTTPPLIQCPTTRQLQLNQPTKSLTGVVTDATSGVATSAVSAPVSTARVGSFATTFTAADVAGNTATATCSYTVSYRIGLNYSTTTKYVSGCTIPIDILLEDYSGKSVASKTIALQAKSVTNTGTGAVTAPTAPGKSNPGGVFSLVGGRFYEYDLKTTGYKSGSYTLDFTAGSDPVVHHASFVIR